MHLPLPPRPPNNVQMSSERADHAEMIRIQRAERDEEGSEMVCQQPSSDTALYAKFHKTLSHNDLGEVTA
ncbi:unnamed protein product, partial [Sphacelaria rigidula]